MFENHIEKPQNLNIQRQRPIPKQSGISVPEIVGQSGALKKTLAIAKLISMGSANTLILGESGTGKDLIARYIHLMSSRNIYPFIAINCSAIPETLMESELFGYTKGSFTGAVDNKVGLIEEADQGTLFLDEIGDLTLSLQAKLLRVLQDKEIRRIGDSHTKKINVRIIAATHKNLSEMIAKGTFREDLFYRLNVIPLFVPPLRERIDDIPLLATRFLSRILQQNHNVCNKYFTPQALRELVLYPWPGNIRELENLIERVVTLSSGERITENTIREFSVDQRAGSEIQLGDDTPTLSELEVRYIKVILKKVNYRREKAARILGVSRRTLYRKEQIFGPFGPEE